MIDKGVPIACQKGGGQNGLDNKLHDNSQKKKQRGEKKGGKHSDSHSDSIILCHFFSNAFCLPIVTEICFSSCKLL